jgi:hypothetical protein
MKRQIVFSILPLCMVCSAAFAEHAMVDDQTLMKSLSTAAPANILQHATVLNMGEDGKMKTIQQGDNGWTCMDPGGEPMCGDAAAMAWAEAGFIYMLNGDSGTSNTDPYASKQTDDNNWIKTGPHVMIVGAGVKDMAQAYPREATADPTKPYVMWPATPYEHLMLPIQ